ncbi:MAG: hypothetical protein M1120_00605 [Patescibacteria group bacterium]|nr:hypothetical protein [Patescibacteria group bacterium]
MSKFKVQNILFIFLFSVFCFLFPGKVFASTEFLSDYNVTYYVQDSGPTLVQQQITFTNQQTNLYATESEITVGSTNISNVIASDGLGNLALKISQDKDTTKIHVFFNQKVVGRGKKLNWNLEYQTTDVLSKIGLIKEINVPRLELDPDINSYNLSIIVPANWGEPAYVKPVYKKNLVFNKDELSRGQISIAYGSYQIFDFKLKYHLNNPRITPVLTEIALPPDTNYQSVFINSLSPAPLTVNMDKDGNWLAKYALSSGENLDILATGSAKIFLNPNPKDSNLRASVYLSAQKYWEVNDPQIQALAQKYKTPEAIYNYVVTTLRYNYNKVNQNPQRLGAVMALTHPDQAICMEFTDLFIAIARAAGIPAREVDGYAFTTNERLRPLSLEKDILHAWPEYYDGEKWIQVDPTWQNTTGGVDFFHTFDFNHLAFSIKGVNSQYPYPAGSYKINNQETKDVDVSYSKNLTLDNPAPALKLSLVFPSQAIAGFPISGKLLVNNSGPSILIKHHISFFADKAVISPNSYTVNFLPPFGKKEIDLTLNRTSWFAQSNVLIRVSSSGQNLTHEIIVKPVILIYLLPVLLILVFFTFIIAILKRLKKPHEQP